jgi:multidrug efflux pump subunit AcrB
MSVALLTSLVLALFFTPVLAEWFVKSKRHGQDIEPDADARRELTLDELEEGAESGRVLRAIITRYEWVLARALDRRWIVVVLIAVVMLCSYLVYRALGSEFLPEFDESAFVLDYWAPPGASLAETDRMLRDVEEKLMKTPEVESYSRRTGLEMGLFVTEPNRGDFAVKLKPGHRRATAEVISDLRAQIAATEPALEIEFVGIVPDVIGDLQGNPEPIEIKLFSEDAAALQTKANEVEASIKKVSGVVDTKNGVVVSGPAVTLKIDPLRAARFGVTTDDVARTAAAAMTGNEASFILQQDRLIKVRVVFPTDVRTSLDKVKAVQVRSSTGQLFRIDQVADVEYDKGQTEIERENLRQMVPVTGRLEGKDLGTAITEIKTQLAKDVKLPPGMTIEYGGLYQEQQSSFRELMISLILAVVLVFITLLIEFRSFAHPIAIVTGAVLALSGVLLALFLTGMTLNVVSMMGMIMIVGIVAKNGILMLDAVADHLAAGDTLREALLRSGRRRFRPVLMTSLAAMLGMLPLALAFGAGSELLQPLAIGVIGGLTIALLLSLVVTPTVYAMLRRESAPKL